MKVWPDAGCGVKKVVFMTQVWHPYIDEEGNVAPHKVKMSAMEVREHGLTISDFVMQMMHLFMIDLNHPFRGALNKEAAKMHKDNPDGFMRKVVKYCQEYAKPVHPPSHEVARTISPEPEEQEGEINESSRRAALNLTLAY